MLRAEITSIRCQPGRPAVDFDQQLARHAQALIDAEGFVEVGSLISPSAHGGAAVHAHHDFQRCLRTLRCSTGRRAYSSAAAGSWMEQADHHQQAVVAALDDVWTFWRVRVINDSTAVPRIGKKAYECSGG
jgi:hypothetical protein